MKTLNQRRILEIFPATCRRVIASCEVLDCVDSTNSYLLQIAQQREPNAMFDICCAETQTGGRGRMGQRWDSPRGGMYLSVLSECHEAAAIWLGLTAAVEVAIILKGYGVTAVGVKWPNDIYCEGGKLGGILVEQRRTQCVVGLGLNYDNSHLHNTDYVYVGLKQLGVQPDRNVLMAALMGALTRAFIELRQTERQVLVERYARFDYLKGKPVQVFAPDGTVSEGTGVGIVENAGFCIEHTDGYHVYQTGEVKIRP